MPSSEIGNIFIIIPHQTELEGSFAVVPLLFVTDLDNTLVGEASSLEVLNHYLAKQQQAQGKVVYSTGRSLTSYRHLQTECVLLEPDALVAAVGTEIYYAGQDQPDLEWQNHLASGWDRDQVTAIAAHFADLVLQPESEQRPMKVSYLLTPMAAVEVLPQLEEHLQQQGLQTKLIYSSDRDLDIIPRAADKGQAMGFLRQKWQFSPEQTVVCGDSGNDIALFAAGMERGIIVGNAQPELQEWSETHASDRHYQAKAPCAAGILEGLHHFGFFESNT